jgi:recombination protein RecA
LDLAISGQSELGGGLPGGILVEVFGPSGTGKTVLLSEIAGGVRRQGGNVMFHDPEARLNGQFAKMFGLDMDDITYSKPDTIVEVFKSIREWDPGSDDVIHGVFADSLAALTTDAELAETDKYGMRRAKEFSEQLRLTCRVLAAKGMLLVCSNQIRQNPDAGPYGQKFKSPGGEAIGFYSSVRLRTASPSKLKKEVSVRGRKHSMVVGVEVDIEVHKNSLAAPYHRVPVMIRFDYGIDDVTANLQFIKTNTNATKYQVAGTSLAVSLEQSAQMVEEQELEQQLASEVRQLWLEIQGAFGSGREKRRS